jgi:hypothetical protein
VAWPIYNGIVKPPAKEKKRAPRRTAIAETSLYEPVRDWLAAAGYTVRAEVRHCDVVAVRDGELVAIELKTALGLELLMQAARRQRYADSVYVAVPRPAKRKRWRDTLHLLRRLELGLILVADSGVQIALHPVPYRRQRRSGERRAVLTELAGRSGDYNRGGSTRATLVTAYRESALRIACALAEAGPSSPRRLRALGTCESTQSILYSNFYGWFERIAQGTYALSGSGRKALVDYAGIASRLRGGLKAEGA